MTAKRASEPRWIDGKLPWIGGAALAFVVGFFVLRTDAPTPTPTAPNEARGEAPATREQAEREAEDPQRDDEPSLQDEAVERIPARPASDDPETPTTALAEDDPLRALRAARADRSEAGTKALVAKLTSDDEVIVAEAANALVARRATEAIDSLAKIDLAKAAGSGLSIIDALGRLGGLAEGDERSAAVDRLLAMLAEEKKRNARESPGNLLQIYEALGETRDPRAAGPLGVELLDPNVPRAPKVVIVKAIVTIGQKESRTPLTAARREQASSVADDAFEEEIRKELVGVIDAALEKL